MARSLINSNTSLNSVPTSSPPYPNFQSLNENSNYWCYWFIGRNVRNALVQTDHKVSLVVRDPQRVGKKSANEEIIVADLGQARKDWFELFGEPDAVLHLAWGGLPNYTDNYHIDVELPMQSRFLTAIIDSGLKKLVVTGTCYEYGLVSGAVSESQETNPNTPYGIAKDRLRAELFELQSMRSCDLTWARIFTRTAMDSQNILFIDN